MLQMQLAQGPEDIPSEVSSFYNWSRLHGISFLCTCIQHNENKSIPRWEIQSNRKKTMAVLNVPPPGEQNDYIVTDLEENRFDILEMRAITIT